MLPLETDRRILASDENRLVLAVHLPRDAHGPFYYLGLPALAAGAVAAAAAIFRPYLSITSAVVLWLAISLSAIAYTMTSTVLVALRDRNELFLEMRNRITRRRHRKELGPLSAVRSYEVAAFLDTETDAVPRPVYELRLNRDSGPAAVWYSGSRETAAAAGEELVRLARGVGR